MTRECQVRVLAASMLAACVVFNDPLCRAKDAFFFDTPPAKRAERGKPKPAAAPMGPVIVDVPNVPPGAANDAKQRAVPIFAQFKPAIQVELSFAARVCTTTGSASSAASVSCRSKRSRCSALRSAP